MLSPCGLSPEDRRIAGAWLVTHSDICCGREADPVERAASQYLPNFTPIRVRGGSAGRSFFLQGANKATPVFRDGSREVGVAHASAATFTDMRGASGHD